MGLFTTTPAERYGPALLDRLPLGVSVYRLDDPADPASLRLVYANAASDAITGLVAADEVGRRLVEVAPGLRETGLLEAYADVVRSGEPRDLGTVEYGDARIERGVFAVRATPLGDDALAVVFEDVAERSEVAELRASEARFRSLVEAAAAIVWTTPPSGELGRDQAAWHAFTGQAPDEAEGAGWLDAVHPDDRDATERAWAEALAARAPYHAEHRLRTPDGTYRRMAVRAVPVLDADGEVAEWVGVHTDVEAERTAAAELAASEVRFRSLFDAIDDVVLVYPLGPDGPGPFVAFNEAALARYGYAADELRAMTVEDLLAPGTFDLGATLAGLRRIRRGTYESVHVAKDGARLPTSTAVRLTEYDGRLCAVAVCRDDADRRAFRRQIARDNRGLERAVAERTAQLAAFSEDLKILHGITTREFGSAQDRFEAYLDAGREMFELPVGILSATPTDPETGERLYRLEAVRSPDPEMTRGLTVPLAEAFCDAVVEREETVAYADAEEEAPDHPACTGRGLRAFIGTPVCVGGDLVGTLNFVSPEPRPGGFSEAERDLIEVMAETIGRRIEADRTAAERSEAQERYQTIVETVDAGVIVLDPDLRVVFSNPSAQEFLGLAPVEGRDETDVMADRWPVLDPDGQPAVPEALPERVALATAEPVRGRTQGIARPDGETRWYRVNATPIDHDSDGRPEAVVVSFEDVTEFRQTAAAAERAGGLLRSVLTASPDGVMAFGAARGGDGAIEDFVHRLVNPRAAEIVGIAAPDLVGRRLLDVFPGNREAGLFDAYVGVVERAERFETVVRYPHDGLDTSFRVTAVPLPSEDGFVVTFAEVLDLAPDVEPEPTPGGLLGDPEPSAP